MAVNFRISLPVMFLLNVNIITQILNKAVKPAANTNIEIHFGFMDRSQFHLKIRAAPYIKHSLTGQFHFHIS
jgi:hypothetical protein